MPHDAGGLGCECLESFYCYMADRIDRLAGRNSILCFAIPLVGERDILLYFHSSSVAAGAAQIVYSNVGRGLL